MKMLEGIFYVTGFVVVIAIEVMLVVSFFGKVSV